MNLYSSRLDCRLPGGCRGSHAHDPGSGRRRPIRDTRGRMALTAPGSDGGGGDDVSRRRTCWARAPSWQRICMASGTRLPTLEGSAISTPAAALRYHERVVGAGATAGETGCVFERCQLRCVAYPCTRRAILPGENHIGRHLRIEALRGQDRQRGRRRRSRADRVGSWRSVRPPTVWRRRRRRRGRTRGSGASVWRRGRACPR